jgi:hypothetical protein
MPEFPAGYGMTIVLSWKESDADQDIGSPGKEVILKRKEKLTGKVLYDDSPNCAISPFSILNHHTHFLEFA